MFRVTLLKPGLPTVSHSTFKDDTPADLAIPRWVHSGIRELQLREELGLQACHTLELLTFHSGNITWKEATGQDVWAMNYPMPSPISGGLQ